MIKTLQLGNDNQIKQMNYRWKMIKTLQLGLAGVYPDGRARQRLLGSTRRGESLQDNEDKKTVAWFCKEGEGGKSSRDYEDKTTNT